MRSNPNSKQSTSSQDTTDSSARIDAIRNAVDGQSSITCFMVHPVDKDSFLLGIEEYRKPMLFAVTDDQRQGELNAVAIPLNTEGDQAIGQLLEHAHVELYIPSEDGPRSAPLPHQT